MVRQQVCQHHDPGLRRVVGIRPVDGFHEGTDAVPVDAEVPAIFVVMPHNDVTEDIFKEIEVGEIATPPLEPVSPRRAPPLLRFDEEPVRCLHVRRMGRDLDPEQGLEQLRQLAPYCIGPGDGYANSVEEPPIRIGQEIELANDDRAAHLRRVSPGNASHYRRQVPPPLGDPFRVDATVEKPIFIGQGADYPSAFRPAIGADVSPPPKARECGGLAVELFGGEQAPGAGIAQGDATNGVGAHENVCAEPLR